jgi:hypothetical protein
MTPKPVGYFLAPLLAFGSAIAFGQEAYTPEKSQSDVTWIAWGIGIIVIATVGFFLFKSFKNKSGEARRVSEPPAQQPKPASFHRHKVTRAEACLFPIAGMIAPTLREGFTSDFCNVLPGM